MTMLARRQRMFAFQSFAQTQYFFSLPFPSIFVTSLGGWWGGSPVVDWWVDVGSARAPGAREV